MATINDVARLSARRWPKFDFANEFEFAASWSMEGRDGSRICLMEHLVQSVLDPKSLEFCEFNVMKMQKIVNLMDKNIICHVKMTQKSPDLSLPIPCTVHLSLEVKDISQINRQKKTNIKTGPKLSATLFLRQHEYDNLDIFKKLQMFALTMQLADFLQSFRFKVISTHSVGYYYRVFYDNLTMHTQRIESFKILPGSQPINHHRLSAIIYPYIKYSSVKPIKHLQAFHSVRGRLIPSVYPIARQMRLDVINKEIAAIFRSEYLLWLNGEMRGQTCDAKHDISPSVDLYLRTGEFVRSKTFILRGYHWLSKDYKQMVQCFEPMYEDHILAGTNLAGGLREIGGAVPLFLQNLLDCLVKSGNLPSIEFDQISINMYQHRTTSKKRFVSFASLDSHEESKKFKTLYSLSMGMDGCLSFDCPMGVDGSAALELPQNSLIEWDMQSYWMSASEFAKDNESFGGKHSILQRHCILHPGEWRIVILFRQCKDEHVVAARRHLEMCGNADDYCFCMNPFLPPR